MDYSPRLKETQRKNTAKLFDQQKFADVTFIIGEHQEEFKANRIFPASISDVFKAMLYGSMKEGKDDSVITIEDIAGKGIKSVLNFAYSKNPQITVDNVVSVKNVCRKYDISGLSAECDLYFERIIDAENVCILLDQATSHKLDEWAAECMNKGKTFGREAQDILKTDAFMEMGTDAMRLLLQCDLLSVNEKDLWDAVMKWAERKSNGETKRGRLNNNHNRNNVNQSDNGNQSDIVNQSEILRRVSPYIRFGLMKMPYFIEKVKSTGCLSKDEVIAVFEYMAMRGKDPKYQCGKFNTNPRKCIIDLTLKRFDVFSPLYHRVSNGGLDINGIKTEIKSRDCSGYLVYPQVSDPSGYSREIHCWSVMAMPSNSRQKCYLILAVVSRRKPVDEIGATAGTNKRGDKWTPNPHIISECSRSDIRGHQQRNDGEIFSIVLDSDDGQVYYYLNDLLVKEDIIKRGKKCWIAMVLCGTDFNPYRVVQTPEAVVTRHS